MSELGHGKPTVAATEDDIEQATWMVGEALPSADISVPGGSKQTTGWVQNEEPPYDFFNWFWRLLSLWLPYVASRHIRHFSEASDCASLFEGQIFALAQESGMPKPFSGPGGYWEQAAAGTITKVCTDGVYVYYAIGTSVYRALRTTGALDSGTNTRNLGATVNAIFCEGENVYAVTDANGGNELFYMSRSDFTDNLGPFTQATLNLLDVASNGVYEVHLVNSGAGQPVVFKTVADGNTAGLGAYAVVPTAVAMDYDQTYVIGPDAGAGVQIRAYLNTTQGTQWSSVIPGAAGAATLHDVAADGEFVFVVGDVFTDNGVPANLWVFERETGLLIWRIETPSSEELTTVTVDERYVYVAGEDGGTYRMYMYDKRIGSFIKSFDHGGAINQIDTDADAIFVGGGAGFGSFRLRRLPRGNPSMMYVRVDSTDPARRPFAKLLVPTNQGH